MDGACLGTAVVLDSLCVLPMYFVGVCSPFCGFACFLPCRFVVMCFLTHVLCSFSRLPTGEQIRSIQAESGAKVDVKRETKTAVITGDPESVQKAAEMVTSIVSKAQAVIDSKVCRALFLSLVKRTLSARLASSFCALPLKGEWQI